MSISPTAGGRHDSSSATARRVSRGSCIRLEPFNIVAKATQGPQGGREMEPCQTTVVFVRVLVLCDQLIFVYSSAFVLK